MVGWPMRLFLRVFSFGDASFHPCSDRLQPNRGVGAIAAAVRAVPAAVKIRLFYLFQYDLAYTVVLPAQPG
jgi:hypothetical protein